MDVMTFLSTYKLMGDRSSKEKPIVYVTKQLNVLYLFICSISYKVTPYELQASDKLQVLGNNL